MAVKSILDIEVNDSSFKAFNALFEKYQGQVKKMPAAWADAEKATKGTSSLFADMTAALLAQNQLLQDRGKAQDKEARTTQSLARTWTGIARTTHTVASNIVHATTSLLKWAGILGAVGGLLGAGGLYGIDRLALSVGGSRRAAQGVGADIGGQTALRLNYSRYFDTDSALEKIADAKSDFSKRWAFSALGVNPEGKDPTSLATELAARAKAKFDASDQSQQFADANGLSTFFSMDELRRLHATSASDLAASQGRFGQDRGTVGPSDAVASKWQNFAIQLDRAGSQLETVFVNGISKLVGPLGQLSEGFTNAVSAFLQSPLLKGWIDSLAAGLDKFATYINSPDFQTDVKSFIDNVAALAHAVGAAAAWIGRVFGVSTPGASPDAAPAPLTASTPTRADLATEPGQAPRGNGWFGHPVFGPVAVNNPGNLRQNGQFAQYDSSSTGIRAIANQLRIYQNRDHLDTIEGIVKKYAPVSENDTAGYIKYVSDRTGYKADQHLNLNDSQTMAALVSAITKRENVKSNYTPETVITILNQTGGSAVVSTSQVAR